MIVDGIVVASIPDGWDYAPIGSFCDFAGGTQPPKSTFEHGPKDGYVRLLQIRDFETDEYAVYIPHQKRLRVVDEHDISIARYGASVGRILTGKSGAINVAIMTTFPVEARVSRAFLQYLRGYLAISRSSRDKCRTPTRVRVAVVRRLDGQLANG